jgi:hypothetical protein
VEAGGKQRNRLAEISDYLGSLSEMGNSKSVATGPQTPPEDRTALRNSRARYEDEGSTLLLNIGKSLPDYTASYC